MSLRVVHDPNAMWRNHWTDENTVFMINNTPEDIYYKMLMDARASTIRRIDFARKDAVHVIAAAKRCQPWASHETWSMDRIVINIDL